MENQAKPPLLTPAEIELKNHPNVIALTERFGIEWTSSLNAFVNTNIHHKVQVMIATWSGTTAPPKPDFSQYAPLAGSAKIRLNQMIIDKRKADCPTGRTIDDTGKEIFDMDWKTKGFHCTQLPNDHPDYAPF